MQIQRKPLSILQPYGTSPNPYAAPFFPFPIISQNGPAKQVVEYIPNILGYTGIGQLANSTFDNVRTLWHVFIEVMNVKADVNINFRTTSELKMNANEVLRGIGLDMSTAINIFLAQVVNKQAIPFELTAPSQKKQAKVGGWEGKLWMSDDFDEPMDEYGRFANDLDYGKFIKEAWDE